MALAFNAATASTSSINGASTMAITHTATGANRIAVIGVFKDNPSTVSTVTYDGVAATFVRTNTVLNGNYSTEIWYIIAPATGAKTVRVTFTGAAFGAMACLTLTGAKQSAQPNANGGANAATATSATLTMTTTVAPTWCVGFFQSGQTSTLGVSTNTTSRAQWNDTYYTYSIMITSASADQTPAGSFSQIGTWSSNACGGSGLAIQELNAVGATTGGSFLLNFV